MIYMRQFLNKWLNPNTHPIAQGKYIIAYIRVEENILSIEYRKIHEFVTVGEVIGEVTDKQYFRDYLNFESFCDSPFCPTDPITYDINCIIAWMHLPNLPRNKK